MDSDTDATPDTDDPDPDRIDYDRLADRVLDRIEPASVVGDRVVLSRRQAIALGTGATSLAALGLFSGEASADVVGQVGTSADRVDVFAGAVDANSVSTDQIAFGSGGNQSPFLSSIPFNIRTQFPSTASTSFSTVGDDSVRLPDFSDFEPGTMGLYGRYIADIQIGNSSQTVSSRIQFDSPASGSEIAHTGNTNFTTVSSSWFDISNSVSGGSFKPNQQLKSSGGATAQVSKGTLVIIGRPK